MKRIILTAAAAALLAAPALADEDKSSKGAVATVESLGVAAPVDVTSIVGPSDIRAAADWYAKSGDTEEAKALLAALQASPDGVAADDKMGEFEIQDLMSRFNQAETTASSVAKRKSDTAKNAVNNVR